MVFTNVFPKSKNIAFNDLYSKIIFKLFSDIPILIKSLPRSVIDDLVIEAPAHVYLLLSISRNTIVITDKSM